MSIFEKIVSREIPALIIYEDEYIISFMDLYPISKGHVLVCPKVCYPDIFSMPHDILARLILVTQKIAGTIKATFKCDGINLINNNGVAAGQVVFHYHMHIIPRYQNDQLGFNFPHQQVSEKERTQWYEAIKAALS